MSKIKVKFLVLLILLSLALGIVSVFGRNCCEMYNDASCGWFGCDYNFPEDCDPGCSSFCTVYDIDCNWGICCCTIFCQGGPILE